MIFLRILDTLTFTYLLDNKILSYPRQLKILRIHSTGTIGTPDDAKRQSSILSADECRGEIAIDLAKGGTAKRKPRPNEGLFAQHDANAITTY